MNLGRSLFVLLIFVASLYALSDNGVLQRADEMLKSKSQSDQFRAYNDYKNLYLRAMMSDDHVMKKRSLEGIVKSGDKLHIDVKRYSNELKKLKSKKINITKATKQSSYNKPKPKANKTSKKAKDIKVKS